MIEISIKENGVEVRKAVITDVSYDKGDPICGAGYADLFNVRTGTTAGKKVYGDDEEEFFGNVVENLLKV